MNGALSAVAAAASAAASTAATLLPEGFRATYINGRWRKPVISAMQRAAMRRKALSAGEPWPYDPVNERTIKTVKFKGHKHERTKPERVKRVEAALADQSRRLDEYRTALAARRVHDTQLTRIMGTDAITNMQTKEKDKAKKAAKAAKANTDASASSASKTTLQPPIINYIPIPPTPPPKPAKRTQTRTKRDQTSHDQQRAHTRS